MYHIKVIKGGKARMLPVCERYSIDKHYKLSPEGEPEPVVVGKSLVDPEDEGFTIAPGITLELSPSGELVKLPEDGEVVYVTNVAGKTIDTYKWPPKEARAA